jgi:hypothetical protein
VSSDRALYALREAPADRAVDLTLRFQSAPAWRGASRGASLDDAPVRYRTANVEYPLDNLVVRELPEGFVFQYADGTEFCVSADGREIWSRWPEPATLADTETYLLGPVVGFALRLRGVLCLHASAVVIDGNAVALAGGSHRGKSTTAAAFAAAGYAVLSDDLVAVRPDGASWSVSPAYPYLKVWEDSAGLLFGPEIELPRLTPTWSKRSVEFASHGYRFAAAPLPITAIVTLEPRAGDVDRPLVRAAPKTATMLALLPETYAGYLLDASMRRTELAQLGELLSTVRTFAAEPSDDPERLPLLISRIVDAVRA